MTSLAAIAVIILAFQFKPMLKAVFILIVLAGMLVPNLNRVLPGSSNTSIGIANRDLSFTGRTEVWNTMVKDAEHKHRTLQGFGAGGYWITDAYNPISTINELDWDPGQGHNGYMDIFIMTGIVGVLVFLFFLGGFINNIFRKVSFVEKIPYLLVLIILINNITESSFFREKHLYFVLFILMYWHVYLKDNDLLTSPEEEWHLEE
jgi:O-antigen ligase